MKKVLIAVCVMLALSVVAGAAESEPFTVTQVKATVPGTSITPDKIVLTPGSEEVPLNRTTGDIIFDVQARMNDETIVLWDGTDDSKLVTINLLDILTRMDSETGGKAAKWEKAILYLIKVELTP
jgi:hypothetical protein